jgi:hypothetical protein
LPSAKTSPAAPSIHGKAVIARGLRCRVALDRADRFALRDQLSLEPAAPLYGMARLVLPSASTCLLIVVPLL